MMKKFLFLTLTTTIIVTISANAQNKFGKGDWIVSAHSTGLNIDHIFGQKTSGNTTQTATTLNLDGAGSWFFADKFAADMLLGFSHTILGEMDGVDYKMFPDLVFGVGFRYYPVGNLFGRFGYEGRTGNGEGFYDSAVKIEVGYDLFLSDRIFFEPSTYYAKHFGGNNGLGLSLGIGVKF